MSQPRRERRRHVMYVTRNTEYHCRDRECVAVRDRRTGCFRRGHAAIRARLVGALDAASRLRAAPSPGMRLCFVSDGAIITSAVVTARRPEREALFGYTSLVRAGVIEPRRTRA